MKTGNRLPILVGVLLLGIAAWLGIPSAAGEFLDPRSRTAEGFAASVDTLRDLGANVQISSDVPSGDAVLLVPSGRLEDSQLEEAAAFVESGGRAVVLDPTAPFVDLDIADLLGLDVFGALEVEPNCPFLDDYVGAISSTRFALFVPPDDAIAACFDPGGGEALVVYPVGAGQVTVLGAPDVLANVNLGKADHARLLAALVLPDGDNDVVILWDLPAGASRAGEATSLLDLVGDRFRVPFWVLIGAGVLFAMSRARRTGPPVDESLAVRIPGSELVIAIGDLLDRYDHVDQAAARLRADLRRDLAASLGLPQDTPPDVLVELSGAQLPEVAEEVLRRAVVDSSVGNRDGLLAVGVATSVVRIAIDRTDVPVI